MCYKAEQPTYTTDETTTESVYYLLTCFGTIPSCPLLPQSLPPMWNKVKKVLGFSSSDEPPSDEHPSNHTPVEELLDQPDDNFLFFEGFEDAPEFESEPAEPVSPPHIPIPVFQPRTPPNKKGPRYVGGVRGIIPGNKQYEAQMNASRHWAIDTRRVRGFPELKNKYKFLYDATGKKTRAQMNARKQREWADLPGNEAGVRHRKAMIRSVKAFDKKQLEDFREEDRINYRDGEQALKRAQERRRAENDANWEEKELRQEAREAAAAKSRRIQRANDRKNEQDKREKEQKKPKAEQTKKGTNNKPAKREREDKPDDGNDATPRKKQKASRSNNEPAGSSVADNGTRRSRRIAKMKPINYKE